LAGIRTAVPITLSRIPPRGDVAEPALALPGWGGRVGRPTSAARLAGGGAAGVRPGQARDGLAEAAPLVPDVQAEHQHRHRGPGQGRGAKPGQVQRPDQQGHPGAAEDGFQWGVTAVTIAVLTAVSVIAGWWLAGRLLRPLQRITATARRLSLSNLHERSRWPVPTTS
jgi:hypothetical protein